jgi:hypothetical protein
VRASTDVRLEGNRYENVTAEVKAAAAEVVDSRVGSLTTHDYEGVKRLETGMDAMLSPSSRRGRDTIIVDEWGPYDWKSPKLWPVLDANPRAPGADLPYSPPAGPTPTVRESRLRVLGPQGRWRVVSARGAVPAASEGSVGDVLSVTPATAEGLIDWNLALEYRGEAVVSPRGAKTAAGRPYRFEYSRFFVPIDWRIEFFEYSDGSDPVKQPAAFAKLLEGAPIRQVRHDRLDYLSGRPLEDGLPRDRFALTAEGRATLPPGEFVLQVIADDGVRVWVDDRLVLDDWEPGESRLSRVPIAGGERRLKVHYYEVGGFAELRFDIQRK